MHCNRLTTLNYNLYNLNLSTILSVRLIHVMYHVIFSFSLLNDHIDYIAI